MLISPLIKPGTVSSTYYNHYSTLRTMEDLFLTGQSCTNPSNADTPLAAGSVCGGLDGQGHIGYAAQSGLASFGPDVFTAEHFIARGGAAGLRRPSAGAAPTALYCPVHVDLGPGVQQRPAGYRLLRRARRAWPERPVAGRSGGNGGNGGNGTTAAGARRQRR